MNSSHSSGFEISRLMKQLLQKIFVSAVFSCVALLYQLDVNAEVLTDRNSPFDEADAQIGVFDSNGMEFSGPYLIFYGDTEPELELRFWADFTSRSPACAGLRVMQGESGGDYSPEYYKDGKSSAHKAYYAPAGEYEFRVSLPIGLEDEHGCEWSLEQVRILARHLPYDYDAGDESVRYADDNFVMLLSFSGLFGRATEETEFEVFCQRENHVSESFDYLKLGCTPSGEQGQYKSLEPRLLNSNQVFRIDFELSEDVVVYEPG